MGFWRYYIQNNSTVDESIATRSVPFPTRLHPEGKNNPSDVVASKLKVGDGILLAAFNGSEGLLRAIAVVRNIPNEGQGPVVDWVRVTKRLEPNPQGGLAQWKKETCFKFNEAPAKPMPLS